MTDGKIVLEGIIELLSPALIGSGSDEHSDCDVILDAEGKPFIPATSFIGVLRHHIKPNDHFWGYTEKDKGHQSSIICSDLYCTNDAKTVVRDGIKIDNKKGIVEIDEQKKTGKKYDYEVVERGTKFYLNLEVNCSDDDKTVNRQMVATIRKVLEEGWVQIGAKTNSGLGKIKLTNAHIYEFDFSKKEDVLKWLKKDFSTPNPFKEAPFDISSKTFSINAVFNLKNSFIIRSYSEDANAPDATSMKSGNDYVMTGTSLKGAIRSRAERILNTLNKSPKIIEELFGYVKEDNPTDKAKKGRIKIDEVTLPLFVSELQNRIKIDRFTGGVMTGALFDSMPLFSRGEEIKDITITITDYKDYEAGLMLLVLKDLWTGDLAVGGEKNVGRGVFEGISATINWNGNSVPVNLTNDNLSTELMKLKHFVVAFTDCKEVTNAGK